MNHSIEQHRKLYKLLNDNKLMDYRHDLVNEYTNGRTTNSADMSTAEITTMIKYVDTFSEPTDQDNDFARGEKMRKRIFSLCHQYGWTYFDKEKGRMVANKYKLNNWMKKYGYLKKSLNSYKYNELPKLVEQFQKVVFKYLEKV